MARTNIVIDDRLIEEAMALTGARSKRQAVDVALRGLVGRKKLYAAIRKLKGRLTWSGDLAASRRSRV